MTKAYDKFVSDVSKCTLCPLHETRSSVVVSRGNTQAKLLFVGEAPGQTEDQEGEPFVGRSGELLDEMTEASGLTTNDYSIVNVMKCHPPGNIFPGDSGSAVSAKAVHTCLDHWFKRQFDLINPSVVVLVGKKALEWTLYRGQVKLPTMQEATKTWFKSGDYPDVLAWFVIYHPSYLLRVKNMEPDHYRDARRIADKTLRRAKRAALKGDLPDSKPFIVRVGVPDDPQGRLF